MLHSRDAVKHNMWGMLHSKRPVKPSQGEMLHSRGAMKQSRRGKLHIRHAVKHHRVTVKHFRGDGSNLAARWFPALSFCKGKHDIRDWQSSGDYGTIGWTGPAKAELERDINNNPLSSKHADS